MSKAKKKIISTEKFDELAAKGADISQYLEPASDKEWRLIVDFKPAQTSEIKQIADRLGINYQATVKMLIDEAVRARQEQAAAASKMRAG
jgi:hypothetical protein